MSSMCYQYCIIFISDVIFFLSFFISFYSTLYLYLPYKKINGFKRIRLVSNLYLFNMILNGHVQHRIVCKTKLPLVTAIPIL